MRKKAKQQPKLFKVKNYKKYQDLVENWREFYGSPGQSKIGHHVPKINSQGEEI